MTRRFRIFYIISSLILVSYTLYWWHFIRRPWNWSVYTNIKGRYSFIYPKEWIVSECGNNEVVVTQQPIKKCYFPLEAPESYIDNLYFQVFLPGHSLVAQVDTKQNAPASLKNWTSVEWVRRVDDISGSAGHFRFWGNSIPINPIASISAQLPTKITVNQTGVPILIERSQISVLETFRVGFISNPNNDKKIEKILRSIRHF